METAMEHVREIAIRALTRVLSDERALDDTIEDLARDLEGSQRAWLVEVCSGVLRHKTRLDSIIDSLSLKKKPTGWLRKILLLSAYQLLEQDRAEPALVVNDTVGLVKKREGQAPSQFVNALLRRISEHRTDWKAATEPKATESSDIQAQWYSLPLSWWRKLEIERGLDWVRAFAQSSLSRPEIWIKLKPGAQPQEFMEPGPVPGAYRIKAERPSGSVKFWPGFESGEWIVQDLASQILVREATAIVREKFPKPRTLDRCAAPGGKSVALAWEGAVTTSTDIGAGRMKLLNETASRVGSAFQVCEGTPALAGTYDWIWVDAPCSGSGILRRHPDVKWLKEKLNLADVFQKQKMLLQEAYAKVPSGGYLMYSICSVFFDEGRGMIDQLRWDQDIVQEWNLGPHQTPSTDGFYGVLLRKK